MDATLLTVGDERLAAMNAAGIDMQMLSLTGGGLNDLDAGLAIELATEANDKWPLL